MQTIQQTLSCHASTATSYALYGTHSVGSVAYVVPADPVWCVPPADIAMSMAPAATSTSRPPSKITQKNTVLLRIAFIAVATHECSWLWCRVLVVQQGLDTGDCLGGAGGLSELGRKSIGK